MDLGQPVPKCLHSGFIGAKDDESVGDKWSYSTCKAPVKLLWPTYKHPTCLQAGCPSSRPTNSVRALKRPPQYSVQKKKFVKTSHFVQIFCIARKKCKKLGHWTKWQVFTIFFRIAASPLSVWPHLLCGAGHEKRRGEQLKWSESFRLYIGSFPCAQLPGPFLQPVGPSVFKKIFSLGLYFVYLFVLL